MKNGINLLELGNGNTAETVEQKSQALNIFFSSIFQNETLDSIPALNFANISDGVCLPEVVIILAAVFNRLKTLNPTKSEGPDRIPPRVLLELYMFLYILLTILFSNSLQNRFHYLRLEKYRNNSHFLRNALRVIQQTTDQ